MLLMQRRLLGGRLLEKTRFRSPAAPLSDEATHRAVYNEFKVVLSTLHMRQERIELPTLGLSDLRAASCATAAVANFFCAKNRRTKNL